MIKNDEIDDRNGVEFSPEVLKKRIEVLHITCREVAYGTGGNTYEARVVGILGLMCGAAGLGSIAAGEIGMVATEYLLHILKLGLPSMDDMDPSEWTDPCDALAAFKKKAH